VVRRLPVLQSSSSDDAPQRPRWHYLIIGAGFTITLWLPLAVVAMWVGSRLAFWVFEVPNEAALPAAVAAASSAQKSWAAALQALPLMLSFFLACFGSAVLVGRFGGKAGVREAIFGNLIGSAVVLGLAAMAGEVPLAVAIAAGGFLLASAALAGWAGARVGKRRLSPKPPTPRH
jgi:tRNA-(ms[2]io[6]A)-hydroxylase